MSCKVLNKCQCSCKKCKKTTPHLSEQIQIPRPTERVIERVIVEVASDCIECNKEEMNAQ